MTHMLVWMAKRLSRAKIVTLTRKLVDQRGTRPPGPTFLRYFGLERDVVCEKKLRRAGRLQRPARLPSPITIHLTRADLPFLFLPWIPEIR